MDTLTPDERSERMRRIPAKGSKPEVAVRRLAHAMGYRFRLHRRDLPGTPDLVFPSRRKVVFVHGCFWHRHDDPNCPLARLPKTRQDFWLPKLEGNRARDQKQLSALQAAGWDALVVWECQTRRMDEVRSALGSFLGRK